MTEPGDAGWSLPGYEIGTILGRGGFATVYRARQLSLDRDVAVKVLAAELATAGDRRRFERERRLLAQLSEHPGIVDVHDAGITPERRPFLVMRLYSAGTLADRVAREGPVPVPEVVTIIAELAAALDAAHAAGVVHRDVKPENVLLTRDGRPALADFGIAAIADPDASRTHTSTAFFSPAHVAPEILRNREYGIASDVYALASTTYQLLTGHRAFDPRDPRIASRILDEPPPALTDPQISPPVAAVVMAGLAKEPGARPTSAGAFATALTCASDLSDPRITPAPVTTAPDTIAPAMPAPTAPVTTAPVTTVPVTTAPVAAAPDPVTTAPPPVATEPVPAAPTRSGPATAGQEPAATGVRRRTVLGAVLLGSGALGTGTLVYVRRPRRPATEPDVAGGPTHPATSAAQPSPTSTLRLSPRFGAHLVTLTNPDHYMRVACWSPDGGRIATFGESPSPNIQIWNATTGRIQRSIDLANGGMVPSLSWSPNGRMLAWRQDGEPVQVVDTATGRTIRSLPGLPYTSVLRWAADNRTLGTISFDEARLSDVTSGRLLRRHRIPTELATLTADFSPGLRTLALANDNAVQTRDLATGRAGPTLTGHAHRVEEVVWSPDGRMLATASADDGARTWDARTGRALHLLHSDGVMAFDVAWSPDSKWVVVAGDATQIWDAVTGQRATYDLSEFTTFVAWSPRGTALVTSGPSVDQVSTWSL